MTVSTVISMACINQIKEYAEEKSYDKALALIREQDLSKSYNPQFLKMCADVFLTTKNYEEARKVLLMAHRIAPEGNKVNYSMIRLYLETGENELAEQYFEQYKHNAYDGDEDLCWLKYMFARSRKETGEQLLEALSPLHTADMSDEVCYEFMRIYQFMGDEEKFNQEYSYLFDNFASSEYRQRAEHLKNNKCAEAELYVYPMGSVERDAQVDAEEKELLERDYLRMNPKEPEIMVMADDYDEDGLFFSRSTLDRWSIRKREKAEKRAEKKKAKEEAKRLKEEEREAKAKALEEAAAEKEAKEKERKESVSEEVTDSKELAEETKDEVVSVVEEAEDEVVSAVEEAEDEVVPAVEEAEDEVVPVVEEAEDEVVPSVEEVEDEVVSAVEETEDEVVSAVEEAEDEIVSAVEETEKPSVECSFREDMTEITSDVVTSEPIITSVEGVPGMDGMESMVVDVVDVIQEDEQHFVSTDTIDAIDEEEDIEEDTDKYIQAFDEYDALLKREEEKLAEQFAMEEQLLLQAQSLLQSVESGVDDWNYKKRDNLFKAFEVDEKKNSLKDEQEIKQEVLQESPIDEETSVEVDETTEQKVSMQPQEVETELIQDDSIQESDDINEPQPEIKKEIEEESPKPHIELREHVKAILEIDSTKKEILQKLKEGR